jgi:putative ABC transport system permease protein
MSGFVHDLRLAFRGIARRPGFAAAAILTLGLGIGVNSALFSVVDGVLLRPLPYGSPETLVMVWTTSEEDEAARGGVSGPDFADWREGSRALSGISVFDDKSMILTGGGTPDQVFGTTASGNFFEVLDAPAALGRTFRPADEDEGDARVVVISDGLWQRRFGGDPGVVGGTLGIDDSPYVVLGIMPPEFRDPLNPLVDLWTPLGFDPRVVPRGVHWLTAIGRVAPDATLAQARQEMDAIAQRLAGEYPNTNAGQGVALVPIHEDLVADVRPTLMILWGAVGLVLLIACTNVAILLLVDASARMKESAVSVALGANLRTLIRQMLLKGALLGVLGSGLGVLLAFAGVRLLLALEESGLPRTDAVRIDGRVLGFTLVLGVLTGVLAAAAPALRLWRRGLSQVLKEAGGRAGRSERAHGALVIAETALALILLIGAGLLLRSFWTLQQVDPGFQPSNVLTAEIALSEARYPEPAQQAAFIEEVLDRVAALPGVDQVSAVSHVPLRGENVTSIFLPGQPVDPDQQPPTANFRIVAGDYFSTLRIPLRRGRAFDQRDHPDGEEVVLIDEAMAERFWPGRNPVGEQVGFRGPDGPWLTVVGVVGDVRMSGFIEESTGTVYAPFTQRPRRSMTLALRTGSDPLALADSVRQAVWQLDADQPVHDVRTMDEYVYDSLARPRFNATVLSLFAGVSLVLAALGTYSVLAYSVAQRRHEIGIRIALGAHRGRLVSMVVGQAMRLVGVGLVVGLVGAVLLARLLSGLLYHVAPTDPLTYVAICAVLLLTALAATLLPSQRATAVDPLTALRTE